MIRARIVALACALAGPAAAGEPAGLDQALTALAARGEFSGAVVIGDVSGVRFARAYGMADPFAGRPFTVDTPVDSGSLAKPVTAAAVLALAADGKIALDAPAKRYVPEFPFDAITVRQLLSHSAGLSFEDSADGLAGKSNLDLVQSARGRPLLFPPGSAFSYCNLCTVALAQLVEQVSGRHYLDFARSRLGLPSGVGLRPASLAEWHGRAIGYRRNKDGRPVRFDSWENERFYGPANLSISARQLAEWGRRWWQEPLRRHATAAATIAGKASGLTIGNWFCERAKTRCHYLGHHEGFHHMLYWDSERKLSVAMVSNNRLAPGLVQPLQRALVAFAGDRPTIGAKEIAGRLAGNDAMPGKYRLRSGEVVAVHAHDAHRLVSRGGVDYPAYPIGEGLRYVPGLDLYVASSGDGRLRWLTLYENEDGTVIKQDARLPGGRAVAAPAGASQFGVIAVATGAAKVVE